MKRRAISLLVAGSIAAVALGAPASATRQQTVTLRTMWVSEQQVGFEAILKNFADAYPNIKVEVQWVTLGTLPTQLLTQFQAGNPPDVFQGTPGNLNLHGTYPLASQGRLLDLSASPWKKRIVPVMRQYVSRRGKIYASPVTYIPNLFLYNRDLMRSIGGTVPTTFKGLLDLCRRARAANILPISTGMASANGQTQLATMLLSAFVYARDPDFTTKRNQKKVTWAGSQLAKNAFQAALQMKNANCFSPGVAGITNTSAVATMGRGQALMQTGSPATRGQVLAVDPSRNLNIGAFVLPGRTNKDRVLAMNAITVAANASTTHPKEARLFIDFMSRVKQAAVYSDATGGLPGYESTRGLLPEYYRDIAPLLRNDQTIINPTVGFPRADVGTLGFATPLPGLFTGQLTVDSYLRNADAVWDRRP